MPDDQYADDLSEVVLNVHRRSAEVRNRLANHPLTRAYLEAGVRLLDHEFSAPADPANPFPRPLSTLTRENVIAEVANGPAELPHHGTVGSFRDRWAYFPDYLADLARYTLRVQRWSPTHRLVDQAEPALTDGDFISAVHEVAYRNMDMVAGSAATALRLRFLLTGLAEHDDELRKVMTDVYHRVTERWAAMFEAVLQSRGLRLRPGITSHQLTLLLTSLAEGLALRATADPQAQVLDHKNRRSLLGDAALALFTACVDPGDGHSIDELARAFAKEKSVVAKDRDG